MNLGTFLEQREPDWLELQRLLAAAPAGRPERLGHERLRRLGVLYRLAVADLAWARRRVPGDPVVARLEHLVAGGRVVVYAVQPRKESLWQFARRGYWRRVRERLAPLLVAAIFLFGAGALSVVWAYQDPGAASGLVPGTLERFTEPRPNGSDLGLAKGTSAAFSSQIFTNNIRVTFLSFAGGAFAGIGTVVALVFNGLVLGVVTGLAFATGNGRVFTELVIPHGVLELSCIVVAAAAGLRLGWAMIEPGRMPRSQAMAVEARRSVEIVLGTMPWLVLAGLVEGFVTPAGYGLVPATTVGVGLGVLYWALVFVAGRTRPSEQGSALRTEVRRDASGAEAVGGRFQYVGPGAA